MREIKFRAWDKVENIMCEVKIINLEKGCFLVGNSPTPMTWINDKSYVCQVDEGHFVEFENLELLQYTGLKDKNGKEIYEGDVVRNSTNDNVVEWRGAAFGYSNVMWPNKIEIIGNIYESPELLTK